MWFAISASSAVAAQLRGRCLHRFAGDMCLASSLIDDARYNANMAGCYVRDILKVFAMPAWFQDNIDFIEELQAFRDTEANWPDGRMDMALGLFAAERGLTIPGA